MQERRGGPQEVGGPVHYSLVSPRLLHHGDLDWLAADGGAGQEHQITPGELTV